MINLTVDNRKTPEKQYISQMVDILQRREKIIAGEYWHDTFTGLFSTPQQFICFSQLFCNCLDEHKPGMPHQTQPSNSKERRKYCGIVSESMLPKSATIKERDSNQKEGQKDQQSNTDINGSEMMDSISSLFECIENTPAEKKSLQTSLYSKQIQHVVHRSAKEVHQQSRKLLATIEQNPYLTLQQLHSQLYDPKTEQYPTEQQLALQLQGLNYAYREIVPFSMEKNTTVNIANRQMYSALLRNLLIQKSHIFYIGMGEIDLTRRKDHAWVRRGELFSHKIIGEHVRVYLMLWNEGCEWSIQQISSKHEDNVVKSQSFDRLISTLKQKKLQKTVIVFEDTEAAYSVKERLQKLWRIMLLPPQTPELSPVHHLLISLKDWLKERADIIQIGNLSELQSNISDFLTHKIQILSYYKKIDTALRMGYSRVRFPNQ